MDPMDALIGTVLFAAGAVFLFGAYKNKRVLGADGILAQAISKGSLVPSADVPEAFPTDKIGAAGKLVPRGQRGPDALQDPINAIGVANKSLANNIGAQLELIDENSNRNDLMPLAQLLAVADQQGFATSTALIRAYVKELTGESI